MASSSLTVKHDLPFVHAQVEYRGQILALSAVLIDTGSDSSCFDADLMRPMGLLPDPDAFIDVVRGIGGIETVYPGVLDGLRIGDLSLGPISVSIGRMGYGFGIEAIIGMDILDPTGAVIDLPARVIRFTTPPVLADR